MFIMNIGEFKYSSGLFLGSVQRSDKMPNDDELFRSLSKTEQRHLLNIHALTSEDSAWRCYTAVNFIRSLDPQLLTTIARLVDKPSSPAADVTRSAHASRAMR